MWHATFDIGTWTLKIDLAIKEFERLGFELLTYDI